MEDAAARALRGLRAEFAARGWYRKATGPVLVELFACLGLAMAGIALFLVSEGHLLGACGLLLSTAGSMGVATNTHTSSHHATSDRGWVNDLLTYFGYPFFLGLSATYWRHKHLALHHPAPNVVGVDADADLWPWFAMTQEDMARVRGLRRTYHRQWQWLTFPFLVALNGFNMQRGGLLHLGGALAHRRRRRGTHWLDLTALLLHVGAWLALPLAFFAAADVLSFYALRIALMGYAMFAVFAPGHFPAEAACVHRGEKTTDPLLLQTATTLNFRGGLLARLFCSGLDHQIEHHLFPRVSHVYYREMSPLVQRFCGEQGLPYRSYSWPVALWKSWMVLRAAQSVEPRIESLRVRAGHGQATPPGPAGGYHIE